MIFLWFPTPASKLAKKPWPRFSTSSWRNWKMTCGSAVRPGRLGQASEEHLPIAKSEGIVWYYGWPIIALLTLHLHELVETTRNHQNIWVNYNDFTVLPNPGIMVNKGNHPQMAQQFRLMKYYNWPRILWMEEILHQLIVGLSMFTLLFQGFQPSFWWCRISQPSTVAWYWYSNINWGSNHVKPLLMMVMLIPKCFTCQGRFFWRVTC